MPTTTAARSRIVVASNRLPVVVRFAREGRWQVSPAVGGLVTALLPVLRARGGTWVGWSGVAGEEPGIGRALEEFVAGEPYAFAPVALSESEVYGFYRGFSNEIVWPLFHDLFTSCVFEPAYWQSYRSVNRLFAETIAEGLEPDDVVWVHDYHLMDVAAALRSMGRRNRIGFFLHVPFPGPDIFLKLPWREEIMASLLAFNQLGFQCERDQHNFLACAERLAGPGEELPDASGICLRPCTVRGPTRDGPLLPDELVVSACPISIDFEEFAGRAESQEVTTIFEHLRDEYGGRRLILGVDRLDYSKGLPQKLAAFRLTLERHPDMHRKVSFVQHVVPSREELPGYRAQRLEVERMVGEINGNFSEPGWVPVHYFYHTLTRDELLAWYRLADCALITPLKDGMNLVAKEYCACHVDEEGVLVLSEFAGAAAEMGQDALLVNPFDVEGVAGCIRRAYDMPREEQRARMRRLRAWLREHDVHRWAQQCLEATAQARCRPQDAETGRRREGSGENPRARPRRAPGSPA